MKGKALIWVVLAALLLSVPGTTALAAKVESGWIRASELPDGAEVFARKWTYSRTLSYDVTDPSAAPPGATLTGTSWRQSGSGSLTYASIPGGFDTGHSLYAALNHSAYSAYTTETKRREVSNQWAGYVYWHWMYDCGYANGSPYRAIYNKKGYGPDNGFYYQYFGAFTSTNGNYSSDLYYCNSQSIRNYTIPERTGWDYCQGATRWFRFDYYSSSYTDYQKIYHYSLTENGEQTEYSAIPSGAWNVVEWVRYYIIIEDCPAPVPSHPNGAELRPGDQVSLSCALQGATVYCRFLVYLDGEELLGQTELSVYGGPFTVPEGDRLEIRARAVRDGWGDSAEVSFSYPILDRETPPTVVTGSVTSLTDESALLHGNARSETELISVSFLVYEKNNSRIRYTFEAELEAGGSFTALATGLTPSTEYRYQAVAMNEFGQSSGTTKTFTTRGVGGAAPVSVELEPGYLLLRVGESRQMLATLQPAEAYSHLYWESEDKEVAAVSETGKVTAVGNGITRVKVTTVSGRLVAYATVEVAARPDISGQFDFSELNMIMSCSLYNGANGFDVDYRQGGNTIMASAYLTRWSGAVLEERDPYPTTPYGGKFQNLSPDYHVQEILYLPWRADAQDNAEIKRAVMTFGAVYSAFRWQSADFNEETNAYYHPTLYYSDKGHAIAIVGWDDDFPASAFTKTPPGDGAFICKNSWGESWGENGYFYISYYDAVLGRELSKDTNAVFYNLQDAGNYDKLYQHDPLGPVSCYDFEGDTGWYASVYSGVGEGEVLKAVGFYTVAPSTEYELYIVNDYRGENALRNLGSPVKSGTIDYAGYHTVTLSEPTRLTGERFAVVLRVTGAAERASVFVEAPLAGHSSRAVAGAGECFVRGDDGAWTDLTSLQQNTSVCLKAFTSSDPMLGMPGALSEPELAPAGAEGCSAVELTAAGFRLCGWTTEAELMDGEPNDGNETGMLEPTILPELGVACGYAEGSQLPAQYDLRSENVMTPVRDQGYIGSCWAFAAYASLESSVLRAASSEYAAVGGMNQADTGERSILLNLDSPSLLMGTGNTAQISVTLLPLGTQETLCWTSSDSTVAKVNSRGIVTAVAPGTAVVTVSIEGSGASASCTVLVANAAQPEALVLRAASDTLPVGKTLLAEYTVYPYNAVHTALEWETSDSAVALVDRYGLITGVARGEVTITAYTAGRQVAGRLRLYVDDGFEMYSELTSNELRKEGALIRGDLAATVVNRGESADAVLLLAFYDGSGRMTGRRLLRQTLSSGENRVLFRNVTVEAGGAAQAGYRLYVLENGTPRPLAAPLSGAVGGGA